MLMLQVLILYVFLSCCMLCLLQLLLLLRLLPLLLHKQVIAMCQVLQSVKQHD